MQSKKNRLALVMTSLLFMSPTNVFATQVKFSVIPTADSIINLLLPTNFTETVRYQVTNNTNITRTLTMVPLAGVSQITSAGSCSNPFTLASQQTCTLTLQINGSQVPLAGINGGPVICKTKSSTDNSPDPFLCSQPVLGNTLAVSTTSAGQHAYIANQLGNSVSFCQINPATQLLSNCTITATGLSGVEGIGFNPAGTFFYSANPLSNSISVCQVNKNTGALSGCIDSGGTGFNLPNAITFSPDGGILYTANLGGSGGGLQSVSACLVNPTTGLLSSCALSTNPTFGAPSDMAVNAAGTFAYVANRSASTISVCNVFGQGLTFCNDLSGSHFDEPEGVTISADQQHIYIANAGSKQVTLCDIRNDGSGLLNHCSVTNGAFDGTGNIGLNNSNSYAYVPNELLSAVFVCDVAKADGQLSRCKPSRGTGFVGPAGIVLH